MSDNMLIIVEGLHGDIAKLRAALATSQADVELWKQARGVADEHRTRLVAELAESVRALAVSQGEVADLKEWNIRLREDRGGQMAQANRDVVAAEAEAERLRGGLERARGLVERTAAALGPCPLQREAFAFLAPPTPTASPESDRASPEVTVKENETP